MISQLFVFLFAPQVLQLPALCPKLEFWVNVEFVFDSGEKCKTSRYRKKGVDYFMF